MNRGMKIPYEVADAIAAATMQDSLATLREEVRAHRDDGDYMHPEDYHDAMTKYIPAMELLINYYGGDKE